MSSDLKSKSFSHHYMPQRALEEPLVLLNDAEAALAECEQQARLERDDLHRFIGIITDLGLEFAPSEQVQWRNRKAIDLERKLAECERKLAVVTKAAQAILDDEMSDCRKSLAEKLQAALTEASEGEK